MNPQVLRSVFHLWVWLGPCLGVLGGVGLVELLARLSFLTLTPPQSWLRAPRSSLTRWALRRNHPKAPALWVGLMGVGVGLSQGTQWPELWRWAMDHPALFLGGHGLMLLLAALVLAFWDNHPSYVIRGEGRPDAQFRDVPEDWRVFQT